MVTASMWVRFLKEQDIKEKIRLEKEAAEKRIKDVIEKYAQKRKLERELAEGLEAKLFRLEQPTEYRKLRRELNLRKKKVKETKEKVKETKEKVKETKEKVKDDKVKETKEKVIRRHYIPYMPYTKPKKREELIFTEEEKAKCIEKTLDELVDEISGSHLTCPPGKELKKDISQRELTVDIKCFRKRVRRKSPEEIVALYDKLLTDDPERLCKEKKE